MLLQLDVSKSAFYQVESMEDESVTGSKGHDERYYDDEESKEEDKTNSRDVGHNIYILAHQVFLLCSSMHLALITLSFCQPVNK